MQKNVPTKTDNNFGKFVGHSIKLNDKSNISSAGSDSDLSNSENCVLNSDVTEFNDQLKVKHDSDYQLDYKEKQDQEQILTIDEKGDHNLVSKDHTDTLNAHTTVGAIITDDSGTFDGGNVAIQQECKVVEHSVTGEEESESVTINHKSVSISGNVKETALSNKEDLKGKEFAHYDIDDRHPYTESSAVKILYHQNSEIEELNKKNNYNDISFEIDDNENSVSAERDHTGSLILENKDREDHQLV